MPNLSNTNPPFMNKTAGVCGGSACIRSSRITVWFLEEARQSGISETVLLKNYPTLTKDDLANAWAYVETNRDEITKEIADNRSA